MTVHDGDALLLETGCWTLLTGFGKMCGDSDNGLGGIQGKAAKKKEKKANRLRQGTLSTGVNGAFVNIYGPNVSLEPESCCSVRWQGAIDL